MVKSVQLEIAEKFRQQKYNIKRFEMLSTDLLKNAVQSLYDMGGLEKAKTSGTSNGNGNGEYSLRIENVQRIIEKLDCFIITERTAVSTARLIKAKL